MALLSEASDSNPGRGQGQNQTVLTYWDTTPDRPLNYKRKRGFARPKQYWVPTVAEGLPSGGSLRMFFRTPPLGGLLGWGGGVDVKESLLARTRGARC